MVHARRISQKSVRQFRQLPDMPSYAQPAMVTSLFWLRKRRHSAVATFTLQLLLSGTVNHHDVNKSRGQFASGPVKQQIAYKIAMMAFSYVRGTSLAYFSDARTPAQTEKKNILIN